MIEEQAQVISVDKNDSHFAWVETQRKSSCGNCEGKSSCGTQVLSKFLGQRANNVKVLNPNHAKKGDRVIIGIDEQSLLSGSFYLYFVPLFVMIVFSLLGTVLSRSLNLGYTLVDVGAISGAIVGFIIGGWLSRKKITSDPKQYQAKIIKVLNSNSHIIDFPISSYSNSD
ncbi:MAG: SoxR reducing system RseC family protein [Pseudomonadota bacterium]